MKDVFGKEHEDFKINTYETAFNLNAISIDQMETVFAKFEQMTPEIRIVVSEELDKWAEFSTTFDDKCIVLSNKDFQIVVTGNYAPRSNDIILYARGWKNPVIYSCCGNIELWDHS